MIPEVITHLVLISVLFACSGWAQAPPSIDAYLLHRGIQNTPAGLRAALMNSDPEVRGFVAQLLAEDGDAGSVPLIREALHRETSEPAKRHLAASLAKLQDAEGTAALIQTCGNRDGDVSGRLSAALQLQQTGNLSCYMSVIDMLDQKLDPGSRELCLHYLRRTTVAPSSRLEEIRRFLQAALTDPAPAFRIYAADCLAIFGDRRSLDALDRATDLEKDKPTKKHLVEQRERLRGRLDG